MDQQVNLISTIKELKVVVGKAKNDILTISVREFIKLNPKLNDLIIIKLTPLRRLEIRRLYSYLLQKIEKNYD